MALNVLKVKHLIFDLDDTLFDTFGLLVRPAILESCAAMVEKGLLGDLGQVEKKYLEEFLKDPRQNIYDRIVEIFGVKSATEAQAVAYAGGIAFYDRDIKEVINTFDGVNETLDSLGKVFSLFLVTYGSPKTQKKKIDLLKIAHFFDGIFYIDMAQEKSKKTAFENIMKEHATHPAEDFVSIGNRIDAEIRNGKELNMQTILMLHGEYATLKPRDTLEVPDATIKRIPELLEIFKARLT